MIRYFKLIDPNTEVSDIFEKDEEVDDEEEPSSCRDCFCIRLVAREAQIFVKNTF